MAESKDEENSLLLFHIFFQFEKKKEIFSFLTHFRKNSVDFHQRINKFSLEVGWMGGVSGFNSMFYICRDIN